MEKPSVKFSLAVFLFFSVIAFAAQDSMDLAGQWLYKLDPENVGIGEMWFRQNFTDKLKLPGSLVENNIGFIDFKLIDSEKKQVIYDNIDDTFLESIFFTVESPHKYTIEVTIKNKDKKLKKSDVGTCLGILILWRNKHHMGF